MEDLASRGVLLYRQAGSPESAAQILVNDFHVRMKYYLNITLRSNKYLEVKEEIILSILRHILVKAAKIVGRETPENAVSLYEKAADTVSITHSILP